MDFSFEESVLDLEMLKAENILQSESDLFYLSMIESADDEYVLEKSFENFKGKMLEFFQKVIDAIVKFFKDIQMKIHIRVQQIELNKKLEELKTVMAQKRSHILNKKFNYFDIKKYKEFYSSFINKYTAEFIKGMNRDFSSVEEYEKWRNEMLKKLDDFNYRLSDEEQWELSIAINNAVKLTTEEANNRERTLKMVEEDGSRAIRRLESYYSNANRDEKSFISLTEKKKKVYSLKNQFIGTITKKLSECVKKVAKFICKHILTTVVVILAFVIAL